MGNTQESIYQLVYGESKLQRADIFTKAFRDPKEWLRVQNLIGIALRSRDSHGKPTGKVLKVATQAAGPAGGDAEGARSNALWCSLEALARNRIMRGTRCRTNLVGKDAERDQYGFLKHSLPSDLITSGPIWELCKLLSPDFEFDTVTLNKFVHHEQCQHHWDRRNVGDSRIAFVGNFKGGALKLDDGRRFIKKRVWHTYNLSLIHI